MATGSGMTGMVLSGSIEVPLWVQDFESFRRWTLSDDFPDQGDIAYLGGLLWVDPSMERDMHNQIKTACTITVGGHVQVKRLGRFYSDNMRLVHPEAELSTESDGTFVSTDSLLRQRVQLRQAEDSLELVGSPDMVLEVVSKSSVKKDTVHLMELYHRAGIREYWLINPLTKNRDFKIYRWTAKKYTPVRPKDGWLHSEVFDKSFRLVETISDANLADFVLEMR